ncbi:DUF4394 domain-containing protein [Roseateles amylovorans]|uniref:DUF4394 domain-containing protein n=1 Tax=Roseateles amylovorans TaxID=2978473 RepID=A0ABY6B0R5_9BURK|nr:DUF4394 domain-containing protein [Roseateles amylovorans]UXH78264.1 DUF4394 domain-containing protein [Roseateles amylovorans]
MWPRGPLLGIAAVLSACSTTMEAPLGPPAKEVAVAVTAANELIQFNAGQPQKVLWTKPLQGLSSGERLLGIDYRVARGQLYGLGSTGQLYRIHTGTGQTEKIGTPVALPSDGATEWGVDFNPTVDRIRVVNDAGVNMRLHPDTGAVVDSNPDQPGVQLDGRLVYDSADVNVDKTPGIVAAGYTYNKDNEKITTNYALDGKLGVLVHQGSKEGVQPVVSPNTGRLFTVGSLGIGSFAKATLDLSDIGNVAYSAVSSQGKSTWYRIDLMTGKATRIGSVGVSSEVVGAAIEP